MLRNSYISIVFLLVSLLFVANALDYNKKTYRVLVVGAVGSGKSALVNALTDSSLKECSSGDVCLLKIENRFYDEGSSRFILYDTPGMELATTDAKKINQFQLIAKFLAKPQAFNVIILVESIMTLDTKFNLYYNFSRAIQPDATILLVHNDRTTRTNLRAFETQIEGAFKVNYEQIAFLSGNLHRNAADRDYSRDSIKRMKALIRDSKIENPQQSSVTCETFRDVYADLWDKAFVQFFGNFTPAFDKILNKIYCKKQKKTEL